MKLLDELREQGYKVKVRHIRRFVYVPAAPLVHPVDVYATMRAAKEDSDDHYFSSTTYVRQLSATGGVCEVEIWTTDDEHQQVTMVASARTRCSNKDTYSKRLGLVKTLGKAVGQLNRLADTSRA